MTFDFMIMEREIGKKGQVVIPKDIRQLLGLEKENSKVIFEVEDNEVKLKRKDDPKKILQKFFTIARTRGKDLTLKDLKKIEEESYDIP